MDRHCPASALPAMTLVVITHASGLFIGNELTASIIRLVIATGPLSKHKEIRI
jgi:hypothetical protein